MKNQSLNLVISVLLISLSLISCSNSSKAKIEPTTINEEITASVKASLTSTKTIQSIPTKEVSKTTVQPPVKTPLSMMTLQAPTLNAAQKDQAFRTILLGSESCRWPCFGGIIPGETKWDQSIQMLGTTINWEKGGSERLKNWSYIFQKEEGIYLGYIYKDNQEVIREIRLSTSTRKNLLKVSDVLRLYGQPSDIFVAPNAIGPGDLGVLQLFIVYRDLKAILYYEWDEKQTGSSIMAYDPKNSQSVMSLTLNNEESFDWSPEAISKIVITYDTKPILSPLSDISDMTIEEFTQSFEDPNTNQMIEMPMSAVR